MDPEHADEPEPQRLRRVDRIAGEDQLHREPRLTALAFHEMFNYSYTWYSAQGSLAPAEIADHFTGIFLTGIRSPRD